MCGTGPNAADEQRAAAKRRGFFERLATALVAAPRDAPAPPPPPPPMTKAELIKAKPVQIPFALTLRLPCLSLTQASFAPALSEGSSLRRPAALEPGSSV